MLFWRGLWFPAGVQYCLQSSPLLHSTLLLECGPLHPVIGCYLHQMFVMLKFCVKKTRASRSHFSHLFVSAPSFFQRFWLFIYLFVLWRFNKTQNVSGSCVVLISICVSLAIHYPLVLCVCLYFCFHFPQFSCTH